MILRKPYAFLMKHFKAINLVLLISIFICIYKVLNLYKFVKDYISTGIYNDTLTPISNYINGYLFLVLLVVIIVSSILFYLLKRKDKPFITYVYIIILMILSSILFIYVKNYFYEVEEFNRQLALLIRDLVLIDSFFYYPIIIILIIRSLGIDLNSFGFYQDKEFLEADEVDREEIEVEITFDRDKHIRKIKNKLRHAKYFFLEHKVILSLIIIFTCFIGIYNFYHYFYVENKIYSQNETFTSNYFKMKVKHTYLTDKDYTGNVISSENRFFIIVELEIENLISDRTFDATKLFLYVNDTYYLPTTRYNKSFSDMGTLYQKDKSFIYQQKETIILIYEVDKPKDGANFLLKYQDLVSKDKKLILIKIKIQDISLFKEKDNKRIKEEMTVPINNDTAYSFKITEYEISDSRKYAYESCYLYNCPIYEKLLTASNNKTLLFLKIDTDSIQDYLSFLKKYAKIRYKIGDKTYTENISLKISKYRGNYAYLEVSNKIKDASKLEIVYTVRTYQYMYQIKGD